MHRRTALLSLGFPFATALSGCATKGSVADGEALKSNQGLLAVRIDSNVEALLGYVPFEAESTFGSRWSEYMVGSKGTLVFNQGETYFVRREDVGEYMWSRFSIYPKTAKFHSTNRFVVKANAITYVGHLRIYATSDRVQIRPFDREDDMRSHIAAQFPKYSSSMPFQKAIGEFRL